MLEHRLPDIEKTASSFNRQAFEATVRAKSPLTVEQFERLFGGAVSEESKSIAWAFMQLSARGQLMAYEVAKMFPEATVTSVR